MYSLCIVEIHIVLTLPFLMQHRFTPFQVVQLSGRTASVAAKILKNYLDEFRESIKKDKLGQGFIKSGLYSVRKTAILEKDNIVDMNVPQWLLNSMCAVWNSEIKVIYAKDKMGNDNYPNAYWHGMNSCFISRYLPKLVNE